ncbi:hypothetical protein WICPIJ_004875 [Wickerhamomyces pijperi]|uniref:Uncharacterized protein n=1 Tax=Wickerhamomyces pijperi TaxID=599730 RepID=A0A9P8Q712_WICPI|nr:hypothetical protein WICPIJ_004875 [Wickerhamomyces pijperi]
MSSGAKLKELASKNEDFQIIIKLEESGNVVSIEKPVLFPDIDNLRKLNTGYDDTTDPKSLSVHITTSFKCFDEVKKQLDPSGTITKPLIIEYTNSRDNTLARFIPQGSFAGEYSKVWGYRCMFSPNDIPEDPSMTAPLAGYRSFPIIYNSLAGNALIPKFDACQFFVFNNNILIYVRSQDSASRFPSYFKTLLYQEITGSKYYICSTNLLSVFIFQSLVKALAKVVQNETKALASQNLSLKPRLVTKVSFDRLKKISNLIYFLNPNSIREVINTLESGGDNPFGSLHAAMARELITTEGVLPKDYFILKQKWDIMNEETILLENSARLFIWCCFVIVFPMFNFRFYKPFSGECVPDIIYDVFKFIIVCPVLGHFKAAEFSKVFLIYSPFLKLYFFPLMVGLLTTLVFLNRFFPLVLRLVAFFLFDLYLEF